MLTTNKTVKEIQRILSKNKKWLVGVDINQEFEYMESLEKYSILLPVSNHVMINMEFKIPLKNTEKVKKK